MFLRLRNFKSSFTICNCIKDIYSGSSLAQ